MPHKFVCLALSISTVGSGSTPEQRAKVIAQAELALNSPFGEPRAKADALASAMPIRCRTVFEETIDKYRQLHPDAFDETKDAVVDRLITVFLCDQSGGEDTCLNMKRTAKFDEAFRAHSQKTGIPASSLHFTFYGRTVSSTKTPVELKMDDIVTIKVVRKLR